MKHISSVCNSLFLDKDVSLLTLRYTVYAYVKCRTSLKKCKAKHWVSEIKGCRFIISLLRFPFGTYPQGLFGQTQERLNDKTK